jgi:hypothetical protein
MIFELRRKTINIKSFLYLVFLVPLMAMSLQVGSKASAVSSPIVIYQVQTGSVGAALQEYVSLYNNSPNAIDITDWCVTYSSASDISQSQLSCLTPQNSNASMLIEGYKAVTLASNDFLQAHNEAKIDLIFGAGLSSSSGHIKLFDDKKNLIDAVGWGDASKPEGTSAAAHIAVNILQRKNISDQILQDSNDNSLDFYQTNLVLPSSGGLREELSLQEPDEVNLFITEILPDAVGTDSGKEFIEIYNSGDQAMSLKTYKIQIGPNFSKSYSLPDSLIQPNSYVVFSDEQIKASLPNTSGSVRLVSPAGIILSTTDSYENLGEGVAWAFSGSWQASYQPTPGADNIIIMDKPCPEGQTRSEETGRCRNTSSAESSDPVSCRPDQERNPATNRCRKISTVAASLLPCKPGQVRSVETNRCRSVASKAGTKAPCKSDQIRNPETGRCKKITTSGTKACPAGQQRNDQTKRCRKTQTPVNKNEVRDIESPLVAGNFKWWFAGFSALSSVGYGFYEWRREAFQVLAGLKARLMS